MSLNSEFVCPICGHHWDWHAASGCTLSYCHCSNPTVDVAIEAALVDVTDEASFRAALRELGAGPEGPIYVDLEDVA